MNAFWSFFWPPFAAGLVIAVVGGGLSFRRHRGRNLGLLATFVLSLAAAALWCGPAGGAARFSARIERDVRLTLDTYEMTKITGHLHHGPLTRRIVLTGPADDFQRSQLVLTMETLPGVSSATWNPDSGGTPLIAEAAGSAVLGFLLGLFVAYLRELRRRYNLQWNW
jgi:hypothetical protein